VARSGYRVIAAVQRSDEGTLPGAPKSRKKLSAGLQAVLVAGVAVIAIAIAISVALRRKPSEAQMNRPQPIAVLPLQNSSAAKDLDFLRIGLADDVANTLSYYPTLSMRPFAITNQYADVDLQKAAREMRVADIITGHFVVAGDEMEVCGCRR
jgi:hypothetical protein